MSERPASPWALRPRGPFRPPGAGRVTTAFLPYGVFPALYLVHRVHAGEALVAPALLWLAYRGWVIHRPF